MSSDQATAIKANKTIAQSHKVIIVGTHFSNHFRMPEVLACRSGHSEPLVIMADSGVATNRSVCGTKYAKAFKGRFKPMRIIFKIAAACAIGFNGFFDSACGM